MSSSKRVLFGYGVILALALAGCSSVPNGNTGRYFDNDGPPSAGEERAYAAKDAVPKVEPPHRWANRPYHVMGQDFTPQTGDKPLLQTGTASWYGKQFHGKKTATGEDYDMFAMTAAHPTMELPSYTRVTNLRNNRSVIVRVNDRGPFLGGRIIDMSYAAAVRLGYHKQGTAPVRVERLTRRLIASGENMSENSLLADNKPEPNKPSLAPEVLSIEEKSNAVDLVLTTSPGTAGDSNKAWSTQIGAYSSHQNALAAAAHAEMMLSGHSITSSARVISEQGIFKVLFSSPSRQQATEQCAKIGAILGIRAFTVYK